ncbi:MAG: hypothetical protein ABEJ83_03915, partial [Candidatus Nanohaloarchaea archaeon]
MIVAFDGLDKNLIEEYNLSKVCQDEFGTIENSEGINQIVTDELYASFITGKTYRSHGVMGLGRPSSDLIDKIEKLDRYWIFRKSRGFRKKFYKLAPLINYSTRKYNKKDIRSDTIFEKLQNSLAIDIPSYNVGYHIKLLEVLEQGNLEEAEKELQRFTKWKKWELFDEMEKDHSLIMAHFHKPDHIHHWYWEVGKMDKVEE